MPNLDDQVSSARQHVIADGYPMSFGELTNLYRDGELIIRPDYQRLFRWSVKQKSDLIESILIGIPLPSIFVAQNELGKWELIDGLQRISTILELQGELVGLDGEKRPSLVLSGTKYLPDLEGFSWDGSKGRRLSELQRLELKRAKIDIKIIKFGSSADAKYDLFQRLNNFGSRLSDQEMRSALIVAVNPSLLSWLEALSDLGSVRASLQLPERLMDERYDLELIVRFFALHDREADELTLSKLRDLPQILNDSAVSWAKEFDRFKEKSEAVFVRTFDIIASNGGSDVFCKWDVERQEFRGSFLNTAFEIIAMGLGFHVARNSRHRTDLLQVARELWARPEMQARFATGRATEARLRDFIPLGRELLSAH